MRAISRILVVAASLPLAGCAVAQYLFGEWRLVPNAQGKKLAECPADDYGFDENGDVVCLSSRATICPGGEEMRKTIAPWVITCFATAGCSESPVSTKLLDRTPRYEQVQGSVVLLTEPSQNLETYLRPTTYCQYQGGTGQWNCAISVWIKPKVRNSECPNDPVQWTVVKDDGEVGMDTRINSETGAFEIRGHDPGGHFTLRVDTSCGELGWNYGFFGWAF